MSAGNLFYRPRSAAADRADVFRKHAAGVHQNRSAPFAGRPAQGRASRRRTDSAGKIYQLAAQRISRVCPAKHRGGENEDTDQSGTRIQSRRKNTRYSTGNFEPSVIRTAE